MADIVPAHDQLVTHRYVIHYFDHEPREQDPHYADFREYKRRRKANDTYHCDFAFDHYFGDTSECDNKHPLEGHHKWIEFALKNGVELELLEKDFPGVSAMGIGAWINSDQNLTLLCRFHHRGPGGVHIASAADYAAEAYIRGLIKRRESEDEDIRHPRQRRVRLLPCQAANVGGHQGGP